MHDQSARIQAWRSDLAAINRELDAASPPRPSKAKRRRNPKPLWEE
jgi:hypothetical protein